MRVCVACALYMRLLSYNVLHLQKVTILLFSQSSSMAFICSTLLNSFFSFLLFQCSTQPMLNKDKYRDGEGCTPKLICFLTLLIVGIGTVF